MNWRTIPSFPDYEASESGDIRRIGESRLKNQYWSKRNYLVVNLWRNGAGKTCYVHRIVCEAFHGPAPAPRTDCAHGDGDRSNNRESNLRWASRAENEADKILHDRTNRGDRNGMAILSDEQAQELKDRAALLPRSEGGVRIKKGALAPLAAEYGVTASCARQIISGVRRVRHGL